MRPEYKAFVKEAKRRGIKTYDELQDLLHDGFDSISGGEFECAMKALKISRWK